MKTLVALLALPFLLVANSHGKRPIEFSISIDGKRNQTEMGTTSVSVSQNASGPWTAEIAVVTSHRNPFNSRFKLGSRVEVTISGVKVFQGEVVELRYSSKESGLTARCSGKKIEIKGAEHVILPMDEVGEIEFLRNGRGTSGFFSFEGSTRFTAGGTFEFAGVEKSLGGKIVIGALEHVIDRKGWRSRFEFQIPPK